MFSRFANAAFRSASRSMRLNAPRRFFSQQNRSLQAFGLGTAIGVSALGLASANVLLAEPEESNGVIDLYMSLKKKLSANSLSENAKEVQSKIAALEKGIEEMCLDEFKKHLSDSLASLKPAKVVVPSSVKNTAFVFIKPHAVTDAVVDLVEQTFTSKGFEILSSGTITGSQIDEKMLIDQHYYAIASKATLLKPDQLNVPVQKFKNKFGVEWSDALSQGVVYNAKDACDVLGLDSAGLNAEWAKCKKEGRLVKFGGGFYCGFINSVEGKPAIYVFNGFFMSMRNKFVNPEAKLQYFVVEWDAKKMPWEDFRGQLLGPTDPADAPAESLRGLVYKDWKQLGLAYEPNVGDNAVHASASPFEALAERMNWLQADLSSDSYGKLLLEAGIPEKLIKEWSVDPQVTYGSRSLAIKMSLFDSLEDTDSDMCLARAMMIARGAR